MSLDANLNNEIKNAMLQKEEATLRTLRAIKSAFLLAKTEKGGNGQISEEQELKVLQKLFNQRKESFEIFTKENRAELAAKEKEESGIYPGGIVSCDCDHWYPRRTPATCRSGGT